MLLAAKCSAFNAPNSTAAKFDGLTRLAVRIEVVASIHGKFILANARVPPRELEGALTRGRHELFHLKVGGLAHSRGAPARAGRRLLRPRIVARRPRFHLHFDFEVRLVVGVRAAAPRAIFVFLIELFGLFFPFAEHVRDRQCPRIGVDHLTTELLAQRLRLVDWQFIHFCLRRRPVERVFSVAKKCKAIYAAMRMLERGQERYPICSAELERAQRSETMCWKPGCRHCTYPQNYLDCPF